MFDPNFSNVPLIPGDMQHSRDMFAFDYEMNTHLAEHAPELLVPFGAKEMIDVGPELAIGELACMGGEDSKADDMPAPDPPPPNSKMTGDVFEAAHEDFYGASDVRSIF